MKLIEGTYCVIDVIKHSGELMKEQCAVSLHYVPSVGEYLHLDRGIYQVLSRESVCKDGYNHCKLTVLED